jgi:hypothetical protein
VVKIAIGFNLHHPLNSRIDISQQSLLRLKKQFELTLINLDFENSIDQSKNENVVFLPNLTDVSKNHTNGSKRNLPMIKNMFDVLYDYCENNNIETFIFVNSDIIVSDRFIKHISNTNFDTYCAARLAIGNISSLDDQAKEISHYQVAGFDAYAVKTKWWETHRDKFPNYIYAISGWDVHYATIMKKIGNCDFCNKWPPMIFHIMHEEISSHQSPELDYNKNLLWNINKKDCDTWHKYLFEVLLRREGGNYWKPFENENELEDKYFKA